VKTLHTFSKGAQAKVIKRKGGWREEDEEVRPHHTGSFILGLSKLSSLGFKLGKGDVIKTKYQWGGGGNR